MREDDAVPQGQRQRREERGERGHESGPAERPGRAPKPVQATERRRELRHAPEEEADGDEEEGARERERERAPRVALGPRHPEGGPQDVFRSRGVDDAKRVAVLGLEIHLGRDRGVALGMRQWGKGRQLV